ATHGDLRAEPVRLGARTDRALRGVGGHRGQHPARDADHRPDLRRCHQWQAPQDAADARRARRRVRRGRLPRGRSEAPRLVSQPQEEPPRRTAGRTRQTGLSRPRSDRRGKGRLVGARRRRLSRLRRLPAEDHPRDPGLRPHPDGRRSRGL
ncbi:MAG: AclJ, partial [uncultured Thermomicrobiales bacterium]